MNKTETLPYIIDVGVVLILIFVITQVQDMGFIDPRLLQAGLLAVLIYFLIESLGDVWERFR